MDSKPPMVFVKCEAQEVAAGGQALEVVAAGAQGPGRGVGRLVDSTQADDRRMIQLVRDRPLLYARSNLPVASYHTQVKRLWREVADIMGWTVADARRKWSHIRNSYSRHLRNEMHGARTGRGRAVSRWYLADELDYLRDHMATDTRPCPLSMVSSVTSFAPHFLSGGFAGPQAAPGCAGAGEGYVKLEGAAALGAGVEAVVEVHTEPPPSYCASDDASSSCEREDDSAYFQFFRGIYKDYQELPPRRQRRFRRQCLVFLHRQLDSGCDASDSDRDRDGAPDFAILPHQLPLKEPTSPV